MTWRPQEPIPRGHSQIDYIWTHPAPGGRFATILCRAQLFRSGPGRRRPKTQPELTYDEETITATELMRAIEGAGAEVITMDVL